jgi:hypothetical protein
MALATGSPAGVITSSEDLYLSSAPYIYYQDSRATPRYNPDANGFYWGLYNTGTYGAVYELGCPKDVSLTEGLTMNDVACDTVGFKATVQQRNYFEFSVTPQNFFPLSTVSPILGGGAVTKVAPIEYMPLGQINNSVFYHLYCPMIYDTTTNDYIWFYFHKCQIVDAWTINMSFGTPWGLSGLKFRAFADTTYPSAQLFGVFGRLDPSAVV